MAIEEIICAIPAIGCFVCAVVLLLISIFAFYDYLRK